MRPAICPGAGRRAAGGGAGVSSGLAGGMSAELGAAVATRLDVLEPAGAGLTRRQVAELEQIRKELLGVVTMWRRLLTAHHPTNRDGRCPRCRGWWRRRRWPCRVWTAAHAVLVSLQHPAEARAARTDPAHGTGPAPVQGGAVVITPAGVMIRARHSRPEPGSGM